MAHENVEKYGLTGSAMKGYQPQDWEIIDYEMYQLAGTNYDFRGPEPDFAKIDLQDRSVSFIGAAQVFGRFCERPFPEIIKDSIGIYPINLGYTGASPNFYIDNPKIIDTVNRSKLCVLQFMSARSVTNSLFIADKKRPNQLLRRSDKKKLFANEAYKEALKSVPAQAFYKAILESRRGYIEEMSQLLTAIKVPVVLLWFSDRVPEYELGFDHFNSVYGGFPQLVNREVVNSVLGLNKHVAYCEYAEEVGRPHLLYSRFDNEPVYVFPHHNTPNENYYYPSPDMQAGVAEKLSILLEAQLDAK